MGLGRLARAALLPALPCQYLLQLEKDNPDSSAEVLSICKAVGNGLRIALDCLSL